MDKPISITLKDLRTSIENALNECKLPACIVEPILFNYWLQIKQQADLQTAADEISVKEKTRSKEGD